MHDPVASNRISRLAIAIGVLGMAFGINATYETYRGTDHSRVPVKQLGIQRVAAAPLTSVGNALSFTASSTPDLSDQSSKLSENQVLRPDSLRGSTDELMLYPTIAKGMRTPFDLWRYYGRGRSSFGSPVLPMRFDQWLTFHQRQKPKLMQDVQEYMEGRFQFFRRGDGRTVHVGWQANHEGTRGEATQGSR